MASTKPRNLINTTTFENGRVIFGWGNVTIQTGSITPVVSRVLPRGGVTTYRQPKVPLITSASYTAPGTFFFYPSDSYPGLVDVSADIIGGDTDAPGKALFTHVVSASFSGTASTTRYIKVETFALSGSTTAGGYLAHVLAAPPSGSTVKINYVLKQSDI